MAALFGRICETRNDCRRVPFPAGIERRLPPKGHENVRRGEHPDLVERALDRGGTVMVHVCHACQEESCIASASVLSPAGLLYLLSWSAPTLRRRRLHHRA